MKKLPAGTYFIGDPCYAIEDDKWDDYLDHLWDVDEGVFDFEGFTVCAFNTKYGDGEYQDKYGRSFNVDAGLIGATPISLCAKYDKEELNRLGHIVDFDEDFIVYSDMTDEGKIVFGDIIIKTDEDEFYETCDNCGALLDEPSEYCDVLCDECQEDFEEEEI